MQVTPTTRCAQRGMTLVELALVAAAAALALLLIFAPYWKHSIALDATTIKATIDIYERTNIAVVVFEKPSGTFASRPLAGGTVSLVFDNGVTIAPGQQKQASATTNHRGEAIFCVVGSVTGTWEGTVKLSIDGEDQGEDDTVNIEVTGNEYEGEYDEDE